MPPDGDEGSGGVKLDDSTVKTQGGDIVGRDKRVNGAVLELQSDKSAEQLVEILRCEIERKNAEIEHLRRTCAAQSLELESVASAYRTVKILTKASKDDRTTVNEYVVLTCQYLLENNLCQQFWEIHGVTEISTGSGND